MAAGQQGKTPNKRKSSTRKRNSTGRPSSTANKRYTKEDVAKRKMYYDEITLMVTLVLSLILLLSNFGLSGKFGKFINHITFGTVGFLGFILPIYLFFGVAFYIANRGNKTARRKVYLSIGLYVTLSAFIQMLIVPDTSELKILELYTSSAQSRNGGGFVGGLLCKLLLPLFGVYGTYIVLVAIILIIIMFLTGKAMLSILRDRSEIYLEELKSKKIAFKEYSEEIDNENKELKEKKRARTVVIKPREEVTADSLDGKNSGKASKFKKKGSRSSDSPAGMTEIKAEEKENGQNNFGGESSSIYEEILQEKFGKIQTNPNTPKDFDNPNSFEVTNEFEGMDLTTKGFATSSLEGANRPHIDDDINRLLQAAEKDMEDFRVSVDGMFSDEDKVSVFSTEHMLNQENSHDSTGVEYNTTESDTVNQKANSTKVHNSTSVESDKLEIDQSLEMKKEYQFPPLNLLAKPKPTQKGMTERDLKETAMKLQKTLESFGVGVTVTNISCGPSVTRYELQPEQGVKVSKITGLADDIKLNLAAADVRIEAPIPGKAAVGIEVPNKENTAVMFRDLIDSKEFKGHPSDIAFAVGKDIGGQTIVTDIGKMPHLLIAGATGSGKSVCINTLIMSILYKAKPSDVRLIMVDPKVVELSVYNGIPHLLIPVVTDPKKASAALNWAVMEMTERYSKFAELGVRDIKGYNEKIKTVEEFNDERYQKLPQIVIIVDELADLMMVAPGEVEDAICRLAQMARAAGLHLIIATQRPSVNVITGLIKANIPSRIAFSVSSAIDSRTIIDGSGAEKLLGKGDMLFFPSGYPKPVRVQGAFVSDKEVSAVVEYVTSQNSSASYNEEVANKITNAVSLEGNASGGGSGSERDDYFIEAGKFIIEKDKASIGMLQRVYKIGFNRAARIMDQLSEAGVVGPEEGTKPRKILMSIEEFEAYVDEYV